jgi:hypothetical protein
MALQRLLAGFQPQRALPFRKKVKSSQVLGEATGGLIDGPSLCATYCTVSGVDELNLRESTCVFSFRCLDHHPIGIGDERERLVTAPPVMTKSRGRPRWGRNNYSENGFVEPPRRHTQALSPAGMFGGKAPLRLAVQESRPHASAICAYAQHACILYAIN